MYSEQWQHVMFSDATAGLLNVVSLRAKRETDIKSQTYNHEKDLFTKMHAVL